MIDSRNGGARQGLQIGRIAQHSSRGACPGAGRYRNQLFSNPDHQPLSAVQEPKEPPVSGNGVRLPLWTWRGTADEPNLVT